MHFHYECNARGLDGKVDGNLPCCKIVFGITRNAPDCKADGNFNYKMCYFSEHKRLHGMCAQDRHLHRFVLRQHGSVRRYFATAACKFEALTCFSPRRFVFLAYQRGRQPWILMET